MQSALLHAGVKKGWGSVYSVRFYQAAEVETNEGFGLAVAALKKWCPDHRPILTGLVVERLAFGMRFEVEVCAYDGEEGK